MVMVSSETLDSEIFCALEKILDALNADRVGLIEVNKNSTILTISYAQYAKGIYNVPKQIDDFLNPKTLRVDIHG